MSPLPTHPLLEQARRAARRRTGDLRRDLVLFAELLRRCGVAASPASVLQCLQALAVIRLDQRVDFRATVQCCLASTLSERAVLDVVFDTFWGPSEGADPVLPAGTSEDVDDSRGEQADGCELEAPRAMGEPPSSADTRAGRAVYGRSRGKRARVSVQQRRDIDDLARRLARRTGTSTSRRHRSSHAGLDIDLRSSLRHNLRFGEELIELQHTEPSRQRARYALLCDVSSSMQPWTPFFLTFAHALVAMSRRVDVGVFNVDLSLVTHGLAQHNLHRAMTWLRKHEVHLSGGTRIGHCIDGFVDELERRGSLRQKGTVALILSDGWDVGEPELLEDAMRRLRRSCQTIVWCDPHAAATGFNPEVLGLRVALPYVDAHVQLADVTDLEDLVLLLGRLRGKSAPRIPEPITKG